jgi:hypothetical protein
VLRAERGRKAETRAASGRGMVGGPGRLSMSATNLSYAPFLSASRSPALDGRTDGRWTGERRTTRNGWMDSDLRWPEDGGWKECGWTFRGRKTEDGRVGGLGLARGQGHC